MLEESIVKEIVYDVVDEGRMDEGLHLLYFKKVLFLGIIILEAVFLVKKITNILFFGQGKERNVERGDRKSHS